MKTNQIPDNTRYVTMVSPRGTRVRIAISDRHFGRDALDYYKSKGFRTPEDLAEEQRIAELEAENARLKAEAEAREKAEKDAAAAAEAAAKAEKDAADKAAKAAAKAGGDAAKDKKK